MQFGTGAKIYCLSGKQSPARIPFLVNFRELFLANFTSCYRSRTISILLTFTSKKKVKGLVFTFQRSWKLCITAISREKWVKTTFKICSSIFYSVRSWGKNQVYISLNHVLGLILEKLVKNFVSPDFLEKSGEISLLDLDLKSFWFRFPFSKKNKSKQIHFAYPEKDWK